MYINQTFDDFSLMSIHFYSSDFVEYIPYGNKYDYFLKKIQNKKYAAGGTQTGLALRKTVDRVIAAKYPSGLPKIIAVLTDGASHDSVV